MSTEQRENLDAVLRQSAFPADIDVSELMKRPRPWTEPDSSCLRASPVLNALITLSDRISTSRY